MENQKLNEQLNQNLADVQVLYVKLHNYHWNVKGAHFFGIHNLTEGYYDYFAKQYDDIAERILPKDVETKKIIQLGKAKFIKENCVVYTEKTDCGACAEHCPTKAVKMELDTEINKKAPKINDEICIGCGACEFACPTKPYKSIYVEGNTEHLIAQKPKEEKLENDTNYKEDFPF